jgi:hypothetical protein
MSLETRASVLESFDAKRHGVGGNRTLDQRIKSPLLNRDIPRQFELFPQSRSIESLQKTSAFRSRLRDPRNDKAPCGALRVAGVATTVPSATSERAQCISRAPSLVAVKTHDSFDPAGSSRTGDGGESTAAANLPVQGSFGWGSERREIAHTTADSRALCTPAPKGECAVPCAGRRLATERWHARVKHVSPQTCVPEPEVAGGIAEAVWAWSGSPERFPGDRLSPMQVEFIRTAGLTDSFLSRKFGFTISAIRAARTGASYRSHPTPPDKRPRLQGGRKAPPQARYKPETTATSNTISTALRGWRVAFNGGADRG